MENKKYTAEEAVALLRRVSAELSARGETRYPCRSDFTDREVEAIKAHLGPWPRALEAAGLKPPRSFDRIERNREKRLAAKRRLRELQKTEHRENPDAEGENTRRDG